jgi:uncharacterized YccA/Bax inhibitor family protein
VRTSSNPVFRQLSGNGQGGYARFGYQGQQQTGYGYPSAPPTAADRPMTIDDVVTKTAATLGTTVVVGGVAAATIPPGFALLGAIVGLVLALIITFRQSTNPVLILGYAAAEGVFLGTITRVIDVLVPGVAVQAVIGTVVVFATMLIVYRTGAVKVTPRLTKWIIGATMGAFALIVVNLLMSFFGLNLGIRGNGTLAIVVSLLFIGIAAFNLLLDFDQADRAIRAGAPARFAWFIAFGLMVTLVWLYVEILNLLAQLQRN